MLQSNAVVLFLDRTGLGDPMTTHEALVQPLNFYTPQFTFLENGKVKIVIWPMWRIECNLEISALQFYLFIFCPGEFPQLKHYLHPSTPDSGTFPNINLPVSPPGLCSAKDHPQMCSSLPDVPMGIKHCFLGRAQLYLLTQLELTLLESRDSQCEVIPHSCSRDIQQ